jgi:hypothetical protein
VPKPSSQRTDRDAGYCEPQLHSSRPASNNIRIFNVSGLPGEEAERVTAVCRGWQRWADMPPSPVSDQEFVTILRNAVDRYFAAVDDWESGYSRYYRMPGGARLSHDLSAEQHKFKERHRELSELLPRARSLCFKCDQPDVFTGLLHVSLGQFAPQERTDSAISRGERGSVMSCLIELSIACRAAEAGLPSNSDTAERKASLIDRIIEFLG